MKACRQNSDGATSHMLVSTAVHRTLMRLVREVLRPPARNGCSSRLEFKLPCDVGHNVLSLTFQKPTERLTCCQFSGTFKVGARVAQCRV